MRRTSHPDDVAVADLLTWEVCDGALRLVVQGRWVLDNYAQLDAAIKEFRAGASGTRIERVDASGLEALDTTGAQRLYRLLGADDVHLITEDQSNISPERRALMRTVASAMDASQDAPATKRPAMLLEFVGGIGIALVRFWEQFLTLLGFSGLTLQALLANVIRPSTWRITAIVAQIHETGLNAVPIIALLTFLVGAVVAFLGATILQDFGATLYTVNLVGFSFLREFAVLLTAILMAGRTASAFTAQIGSMKVNQEIDAIRVQGLSPVDLLVLPRVLAMQISLPILTFVGMISGIAGGMLVCAVSLDISPQRFLTIFSSDVPLRHFILGMAKAPVFAFLIAVIGCLQGFKVSGSAQSVGEHTTSAVVHSIFVVILLDALAALFFMEMGW